MRISSSAFILKEKNILFKKSYGIKLDKKSNERVLKTITEEEVKVTDEQGEGRDKEFLRKNKIALILPLRIKNKTIGVLLLGEKKSGDMLTREDINFLLLLSPQLALACNKAFSFSKVLEDERKIKRLLIKKKEWQKKKKELVSIAMHEVNTPLAALEGYLSMLVSEDMVKLDPNTKIYLEKALISYKKSGDLVKKIMKAQGLG